MVEMYTFIILLSGLVLAATHFHDCGVTSDEDGQPSDTGEPTCKDSLWTESLMLDNMETAPPDSGCHRCPNMNASICMCHCCGNHRVNCVGYKKGGKEHKCKEPLRAIPAGIPPDTEVLNLNYNLITVLDGTEIRHLKSLCTFQAKGNNMTQVESGAFNGLYNLIMLDLSYNINMGFKSFFTNVFCSLQSDCLKGILMKGMFQTHYMTLLPEHFHCLRGKYVEQLILTDNNFDYFEDDLFGSLNISVLDLTDTAKGNTFNVKSLRGMHGLKSLILFNNQFESFPVFHTADGKSMVENLQLLNIGFNRIKKLGPRRVIGLENLQQLVIHDNKFRMTLEYNTFSNLTKLTILNLKGCIINSDIDREMFISDSIQYLNMTAFAFNANKSRTYTSIFDGCTNLTRLELNDLKIDLAPMRQFLKGGLQNLSKLKHLDLSDNSMRTMDANMFVGLVSLQNLTLKYCSLTSVSSAVFADLTQLRDLDISHNNIRVIDRGSFPSDFFKHVQTLHVAYNKLACTCNLYWFRQFIELKVKTVVDVNRSYCFAPSEMADTLVKKYNPTECLSLPMEFFGTVALSLSLSALLLLSSLIYKFRWHVRFAWFQFRARFSQYQRLSEFAEEFRYDVFVSYNYDNVQWVKDNLIQPLEKEMGLCLCIHDRDFLAGEDIVDNITYSIRNSRKVLLVVSNSFARSQWCQLELTMAQHHLFETDRNNLILVMLEKIHDCFMSPRLALQLKLQTYIEWTSEEKGRRLFLKQLRRAVSRPMGSLTNQPVN